MEECLLVVGTLHEGLYLDSGILGCDVKAVVECTLTIEDLTSTTCNLFRLNDLVCG